MGCSNVRRLHNLVHNSSFLLLNPTSCQILLLILLFNQPLEEMDGLVGVMLVVPGR